MSDSTLQPQAAKSEEKAPRNPVERLLVWGGIGLMVIVVFTEGTARFGYSMTLSRLQERIQEDEGPDANPLSVEESSKFIVGFPSKTTADGVITYRFKGLLKEFGAIHLPYDDENTILGLVTDAPPEVDLAPASGEETEADAAAESGMAGMPSGAAGDQPANGGEGGGRRNFDPMQFDADGDGKISLEEAPERMKESFAELDANGDGFADAEEFAARRALRQRQRAEQGATEAPPAESSNAEQKSDAAAAETPEQEATPETPSQPE